MYIYIFMYRDPTYTNFIYEALIMALYNRPTQGFLSLSSLHNKTPSAALHFAFVCSRGPRHVLPGLRWPSRPKADGHTNSVTNIIKHKANKNCSNRFAGNKSWALLQNSATKGQTNKSAENSPRAHLAKTCMQIMKQGNRYKMEPGRFNAPPKNSQTRSENYFFQIN